MSGQQQQPLPHGHRLQGKKQEYVIDRVLGQGSFGITYLAKYKQQVRGEMGTASVWAQVAVKEFFMRDLNSREEGSYSLRESTGNSLVSKYRRAFMREAQNLSHMRHPGIVSVLEVIEANNTAYIVMEYIEGSTLDDYIQRRVCLPEREALACFRDICDAMCYMHAQRMLHLDMKPKNVMRDEEGRLSLIDFGLSKQYTESGEPESSTSIGLGTPGYAPSEQGKRQDDGKFHATLDVYALGATLLKMLTGQTPPEASEVSDDVWAYPPSGRMLSSLMQSAGVSSETRRIVEKAMHPFRLQRYQSVPELMAAFGWSVKAYQKEEHVREDTDEGTDIEEEPKPKPEPKPNPQPKPQPQPEPEPGPTPRPNPTPSPKRSVPGWLYGLLAGVLLVLAVVFWPNPTLAPASFISGSENGHEYVDLGLSVKWATCNVGAVSPGEYGDYFAWGETSPKNEYTWGTLKYCNDTTGDSFSKYNQDQGGTRDNRTRLELSDDAARQRWGGSWRMPTREEFQELVDKCRWSWTTGGGHKGYKVTGPNGHSIFLPAAGYRYGSSLYIAGENGYYWSSSLNSSDSNSANGLYFGSGRRYVGNNNRYYGRSVRSVTE